MKTEERVTLQEAADTLGVSEQTARRWVKSGKLKAYRPGLRYLIPASAIQELLEEEAPKAAAPPSPEPERDPEEERRFLVRGWKLILEDLAARYREVEEKLRIADVEDFPEIVVDIDVLASYNFWLLSREEEEVQSAPGVIRANEKIRSTQTSIGRMLEQKLASLDPAHAAQLERFRAATAAASLSDGARLAEVADERREAD
ncbi:MAG: helix-turn-helix domain-containing protein [Actinomycetota bacterium]|nr:helix-turn-helix domain-containing protein [Actinomycetota bacterium]